ncbi:tyrosine-type recombinase/integrase [Alsobacter metallidurans]|uniref:tyrosine-type recombinase/integrase n=1 Tax=Alsobacter metallidurans TaxID=340221 RepID=UPI001663981C|nr:site-specific integrase [Alsobacter metallidurans]
MADYLAAVTAYERAVLLEQNGQPGTFGALWDAYRKSDRWRALSPRTQADYEADVRTLRRVSSIGVLSDVSGIELGAVDRVACQALLARVFRKHGRHRANSVRAVLSVLLSFAIESGLVQPPNPVSTVPKYRPARDGTDQRPNLAWEKSEIDIVIAECNASLRLPIMLGLYQGLRIGDICRLDTKHIKTIGEEYYIHLKTSKAGVELNHYIRPEVLTELLARLPIDGIICRNTAGNPWKLGSLQSAFHDLIRRLSEGDTRKVRPNLTFHGTRHTCASQLREQGWSRDDVADFLGQKSSTMGEHYSRHADLRIHLRNKLKSLQPLQ